MRTPTPSLGPATTPDIDAVREAVELAIPNVRAHSATADRDRRLPAEIVAALRHSGINRLLLPDGLGGVDCGVADIIDVIERIATVDGSTAWCAVIGAGSNLFAGYLPIDGAREVFADPDQGNASMLAPAGTLTEQPGGYRLSGRWPFTSNCLHSSWIGLGALLRDDPAVAGSIRVAFVRTAEVTIDETWDSAGLRGTGSHHVQVDDVFVDAAHCCVFNGPAWSTGALWRQPILTVFLPLLASVPLGIARGALDEIGRQARAGRSATRGRLIDDPIALTEFGTADARLRAASAGLRAAVGAVQQAITESRPPDRTLQATVCLAAQHATDTAVEAASVAHLVGGGAAAYRGSTLLRALDDVHAARQHLMFAHKHRSELAKALAGLDVRYPPFVI